MDLSNDNDLQLPTPGEVVSLHDYLAELAEDFRENPGATISPEYGPDNLKAAANIILLYGHRVTQLRRVIEEQVHDPNLRESLNKALDHG